MSLNLGTAVGYLELNTDRWVSGFNSAREQMQTLMDNSQEMGSRFQSAGQILTSVGSTLSTHVTLPLAGLGAASIKTAIEFESAFAGVRKTVDATEAQYKQLENGIRSMSKEMPQSAAQIATVAEAAGQLGIQRENVLSFTKVMVELGDTTNLSSEEAASALAQFSNVTGMSMDNVDRLGSTIVALGNNLATTESAIVDMGQRMASVGSQIKMSESEILSWAGAMSSVGISSEVGGSSFSKFAKDVQLAVETGSSKLNDFAKVAGMSASEFSKAFKEDASKALQMFIEGLSKSEEKGTSVTKVLNDLEYKEVGMTQTLSSLAGGYDTLNKALGVGADAWKENTALAKEAETRYQTTESRLLILKNQFQDLGITIGTILLPFLESLMAGLTSVAEYLASLDESTLKVLVTIGAVVAAIGPVLLILGSIANAIGTLLPVFSALGSGIHFVVTSLIHFRSTMQFLRLVMVENLIPAISSVATSLISTLMSAFSTIAGVVTGTVIPALSSLWAFMLANPITLIITAIVALGAAFIYAWKNIDGFKEFFINTFKTISEFVTNALDNIAEAFVTWGYSVNVWIGDACASIHGLFKDSFRLVKELILDQINIIKSVLAGDFEGALDGIKTMFKNLWNNIKEIFTDINYIIKDSFLGVGELVSTKLTEIKNSISNWCSQTWNMFKQWCKNAITSIMEFFNTLPERIGFAIGYTAGIIATGFVNIWKFISETIPKWISQIGEWLSELPSKVETWFMETNEKVSKWVQDFVEKAQKAGSDFINKIISWIEQLPSRIENWLTETNKKASNWVQEFVQKAQKAGSDFMQRITNAISSLPSKIWSWFSQTISKASNFVSQFAQKATQAGKSFTTNIVNGVKSIPSQMISIGRSIVQGIWNGISGMGSWLKRQISSFASGVVAGFKASFKINSPSKIMRDIIGKGIVEGIGVGIENEEGSLLYTAKNLASNLVNTMSGDIDASNLIMTARGLTDSTDFASNQVTNNKTDNRNIQININNPSINGYKSVEDLADELAFYISRKPVF